MLFSAVGEIDDWKNFLTVAVNEKFDALLKEKLSGRLSRFNIWTDKSVLHRAVIKIWLELYLCDNQCLVLLNNCKRKLQVYLDKQSTKIFRRLDKNIALPFFFNPWSQQLKA